MPRRPRSSHLRLFDYFAPLYDLGIWLLLLPAGGEERFREMVLEAAGPFPGRKVLELFAGTGTISIAASCRGADVASLDMSEGMLKVARAKSRKKKVAINPVRGDAGELPFRGETFDAVVASFGLHELPAGQAEDVAKESFRVLKSNGRLCILDYSKAGGFPGLLEKLVFIFVEGEEARGWASLDVQRLLRETGFRNFRRRFFAGGVLQLVTAEKR